MGSLAFLFGAYTIFWGITFAYIYSLVNRQRKLDEQLSVIEQLLDSNSDEN